MTRRLSKLLRIAGLPLICAALFSLSGGHWLVLQTIAWAQMLRDNSRGASLPEAIAKTFDGSSPCMMCKNIAEGQQKEGKSAAVVKLDKQAEVLSLSALLSLKKPESRNFFYPTGGEGTFWERGEAPPTPIPILI
jgi:hypothetical protein